MLQCKIPALNQTTNRHKTTFSLSKMCLIVIQTQQTSVFHRTVYMWWAESYFKTESWWFPTHLKHTLKACIWMHAHRNRLHQWYYSVFMSHWKWKSSLLWLLQVMTMELWDIFFLISPPPLRWYILCKCRQGCNAFLIVVICQQQKMWTFRSWGSQRFHQDISQQRIQSKDIKKWKSVVFFRYSDIIQKFILKTVWCVKPYNEYDQFNVFFL